MSRLKIIKEPAPSLRQKSVKIAEITPEIKRLALDMAETMKAADGIGLAAPQIGQNIRLITINTAKGVLTMVNPKINWKSWRTAIEEEGCLSCPNALVKVKRSKIIYVKCQDLDGKTLSFRAQGLFARVIQHEIDHLNGILIIDKNKKG